MIEVSHINKSFDKLKVLNDVSLTITDGEMLTIVGPSGAGKSTLLQIIGTLERPDSGTVKFDGEDITRLKEVKLAEFRNRNMGFVFQFHQLLPVFTLEENVALPSLIAGNKRADAFNRAGRLLDELGLGQRLNHRPSQLSGGERQRAAVARALVNDPKVILADEPTGSLDSQNRAELYKLFFDLRTATGKTFIIVTHDDTLALNSDRVIRMQDGFIL